MIATLHDPRARSRPLEEKSAGLLDLVAFDVPTPAAVLVWPDDERDPAERAVRCLEEQAGRAIAEEHEGLPLLAVVRLGSRRRAPDLPPSLLALGATSRFAEDRDARLEGWAHLAPAIRRLGASPPRTQVVDAVRIGLDFLRSQRLAHPLILQQMAFGSGDGGAAGMAYTRDPTPAGSTWYGRYREGVEGHVYAASSLDQKRDLSELPARMPAAADALRAHLEAVHAHAGTRYVEFVVQRGRVFLVQCTPGRLA